MHNSKRGQHSRSTKSLMDLSENELKELPKSDMCRIFSATFTDVTDGSVTDSSDRIAANTNILHSSGSGIMNSKNQ